MAVAVAVAASGFPGHHPASNTASPWDCIGADGDAEADAGERRRVVDRRSRDAETGL
jgi:hypothetical protein